MNHLGDITKIDGHKVPLVDIVTGGSPCQDLSVAGKRAGLNGERSGLFMEQIRIIKEMRDESTKRLRSGGATFDIRHIRPRYMVWENVPGAISSNKGEDFRAVLEETAKVVCENAVIPRLEGGRWTPSGCIMGDGWSIAWRVHDAQFWGVPQRRKRIALVADFGGDTAPEILFERKSVSGDIETSRETREEVAGVIGENIDKAISFQERAGKPGGAREYSYSMSEQEPCPHSTTKVYCLQGNGIDRADTAGCNGKGWRENQSYTLNTIDRPAVLSVDEKWGRPIGENVGNTLGARDYKQPQAVCTYQETTGALTPGAHPGSYNGQDAYNDMLVIGGGTEPITASKAGFFLNARSNGKADTLVATDYKDPQMICYGLDRASFNQGQNAQYDFSITEEQAQTLVSRGPGGY